MRCSCAQRGGGAVRHGVHCGPVKCFGVLPWAGGSVDVRCAAWSGAARPQRGWDTVRCGLDIGGRVTWSRGVLPPVLCHARTSNPSRGVWGIFLFARGRTCVKCCVPRWSPQVRHGADGDLDVDREVHPHRVRAWASVRGSVAPAARAAVAGEPGRGGCGAAAPDTPAHGIRPSSLRVAVHAHLHGPVCHQVRWERHREVG